MPKIKPHHADAYLRHTVEGVAIRDLAREAGCHASTITRRVQLVEDSRDSPVWAAIWDEISACMAARDDAPDLDLDALLFYLGTNRDDCAAALATAKGRGRNPTIAVALYGPAATRGSHAAILAPGMKTETCPRAAALGLVLTGVARPVPGVAIAKAARLQLTGVVTPFKLPAAPAPEPEPEPCACEEGREAPRWASAYAHLPGGALIAQMAKPRRGVTMFPADHIDLAVRMAEAAAIDPARFTAEIDRLALGETLSALFRALFVDQIGLEGAERSLVLPSRSGKLALRIGLDQCLGKFAA